jgi:ATP-binding protein involved in chromosome partitioning
MSLVDAIAEELTKVNDPEIRRPITDLGMVEDVSEVNGDVTVKILLTISGCPMRDKLQKDVADAVARVDGVKSLNITFGVMNDKQRDNLKKILHGGVEKVIPFAQPGSLTRVIGIASGKGGVGKSSLTANLAVAASARGLKVGVLDADVYGHSIPRLLNLVGQRPTAIDQTFIPLEAYGVKVVSMEMFKPDRADPIAYRGPMLHRVLEQLLSDAYWGDLDLLLLDLPPGTGDIAISLGQLVPSSEILVITTPQVAAAEVAERAGRIAYQLKQHVIGVVENMSDIDCPHCNEKISLFGSGGGEETARRLSTLVGADVPLIAKIPFDPSLREGGDKGEPIVIASPDSHASEAIYSLIDHLMKDRKSLKGVPLKLHT